MQAVQSQEQLPKLRPFYGLKPVPASLYNSAHSHSPRCLRCLDQLKLPNAALQKLRVLRITSGNYGYQHDPKGQALTGGLELELEELDRALIARYPIDITVMAKSVDNDSFLHSRTTKDRERGLGVIHIPYFCIDSISSIRHVKRVLQSDSFDLIHFHNEGKRTNPSRSFIYQEACRLGIPIVISHHSWVNDGSLKKKGKTLKLLKLLKSIKNFIKVRKAKGLSVLVREASMFLKKYESYTDRLMHALSFRSKTFEGSPLVAVSEYATGNFLNRPAIVIGSAIDTDYFRKEKVTAKEQRDFVRQFGIPANKKILAYHARLEPGKEQVDLVKVASMLRASASDFHFVLAGKVQCKLYHKQLLDELKKNQLESFFTILPALQTADIRRLLSVSTAMVFPTQYEALGRSAIEAMLMELPVVAYNVGGIPGYITDRVTGFLVNKGDTDSMAERIVHIFRNPAEICGLSARSNRSVRSSFDAGAIADDYMSRVYGPLVVKD